MSMFFSKNLKTVRKKWKVQQDEFGEMMEVNRGNISSYETNDSQPKILFLLKLQGMTGINIWDLYYREINKDELPEYPIEYDLKNPPINLTSHMQEITQKASLYNINTLIEYVQELGKKIEEMGKGE